MNAPPPPELLRKMERLANTLEQTSALIDRELKRHSTALAMVCVCVAFGLVIGLAFFYAALHP